MTVTLSSRRLRLRTAVGHAAHGLLLRLTQFRLVRSLLRSAYQCVQWYAVRQLARIPEVTHIYLRRSLAKAEFWPMLSDIDFSIVVDSVSAKTAVRETVHRLHRCLRVLELQSPVFTDAELRAKLAIESFHADRAVLFRFVEAEASWKLIYNRPRSRPIDLKMEVDSTRLDILALCELQYWNSILISFHTQYLLSRGTGRDVLIMTWTAMKSVLEIDNLVSYLSGAGTLRFRRSEMAEDSRRRYAETVWEDLFHEITAIMEGTMPSAPQDFVLHALEFLRVRYFDYWRVWRARFRNDWEYIEQLRSAFNSGSPRTAPSPQHSFDFSGLQLDDNDGVTFDGLEAVLLTPQLVTDTQCHCLVLVLVHSFSADSPRQIKLLFHKLRDDMSGLGLDTSRIEFHVADAVQRACLTVPRQIGRTPHVVFARHKVDIPSVFQLIFGKALSRVRCLDVMNAQQNISFSDCSGPEIAGAEAAAARG